MHRHSKIYTHTLETAALDMPVFGFLIHSSTGSPTHCHISLSYYTKELMSLWALICPYLGLLLFFQPKKAEFLTVLMHRLDSVDWIFT